MSCATRLRRRAAAARVLRHAAAGALMLLVPQASPPWAQGGVSPPSPAAPLQVEPTPAGGAAEKLARGLDAVLARERRLGIYARGPSVAFRLQGHGLVLLSQAVRSPLGAPEAYLRLLDPALSLSLPPVAGGKGSATGPALVDLIEPSRLEQQRAELRRAQDELRRLRASLMVMRKNLRDERSGNAPRGQAGGGAEAVFIYTGALQLAEVARLEAALDALDRRLDLMEVEATEGDHSRMGQPTPTGGSLEDGLADFLLREGRVAIGPSLHLDEKLSIVIVVSELGGTKSASGVQLTISASDLPRSQQAEALAAARKKVLVVKSPR